MTDMTTPPNPITTKQKLEQVFEALGETLNEVSQPATQDDTVERVKNAIDNNFEYDNSGDFIVGDKTAKAAIAAMNMASDSQSAEQSNIVEKIRKLRPKEEYSTEGKCGYFLAIRDTIAVITMGVVLDRDKAAGNTAVLETDAPAQLSAILKHLEFVEDKQIAIWDRFKGEYVTWNDGEYEVSVATKLLRSYIAAIGDAQSQMAEKAVTTHGVCAPSPAKPPYYMEKPMTDRGYTTIHHEPKAGKSIGSPMRYTDGSVSREYEEQLKPYLATRNSVSISLKEYVDMAQTESNLEFRKTMVQPTIYYQAMEAAVKAVLDAAGVDYD